MTDAPRRIQRSRAKGWRMPENTVYVGRPTLWGNPWVCLDLQGRWMVGKLDPDAMFGMPATFEGEFETEREAKAECVRRYRATMPEALKYLAPRELRLRHLACWCPLDWPCHADVLLEIANAPLRCEGVERAAREGEGDA
jgi:hypothetical protein